MRCALVFVCAGIASATFVADVHSLYLSLFCVAFLLLSFLLVEFFRLTGLLRRLVIGFLLGLLGVCWHLNWANTRLAEACQKYLKGIRFK